MSFCTNCVRAPILSSIVGFEAVSVLTICLISGDGSRRPLVRFRYQFPICCQVENPLVVAPPGGENDTTICPATPAIGGMSSSLRMALTSLTVHCHWLPLWVGFTSGWFSHNARYSQPEGSCKE